MEAEQEILPEDDDKAVSRHGKFLDIGFFEQTILFIGQVFNSISH